MVFIRKLPLCSDVLTHLYMHVYGIACMRARFDGCYCQCCCCCCCVHICACEKMWIALTENQMRRAQTRAKTHWELPNRRRVRMCERGTFRKSTRSSCIAWYRDSILIRIVLSVIELCVYLWVDSCATILTANEVWVWVELWQYPKSINQSDTLTSEKGPCCFNLNAERSHFDMEKPEMVHLFSMPCYIVIVLSTSFTLAFIIIIICYVQNVLCENTHIHWCLVDVHEAVDMKWMNMRLRKRNGTHQPASQPASLYGIAVVFDTNALVGFLHEKCIRIGFAPVNVVNDDNA